MDNPTGNPHFDLGELVWRDEFSGRFSPPPTKYATQFDDKWRLVLEDYTGERGYNEGTGVQMDDDAVARLVYEWTGTYPEGIAKQNENIEREISINVPAELIREKRCLDAGCGMGRWTRVMQFLGASEVLSTDISEHSLKSVARFNANTRYADLSCLVDQHPDLRASFDFVNLWGVAHHTHDPRETFMNAAACVKPGGSLYLMLYDTGGMHNTTLVNHYRKAFNEMTDSEERLAFVNAVADRRWHRQIPFIEQLKNVRRNLLGLPKPVAIGVLDMMMPWYNWTVPIDVATNWMKEVGFSTVEVMNPRGNSASRHYLGTGKS